MMMKMYSLRKIILLLTTLHCLQGIYPACEVPDSSLTLKSRDSEYAVIGCKNSNLVMTVRKIKTFRMNTLNNERFKCVDQTFTASIGGEWISITEAKCISRVTCSRPNIAGVHITDIEKQLKHIGKEGDEIFVPFSDYTAGDQIHMKCASGYGQPKSSCDEDANAYDYDLYDTKEELPSEGTFTCREDGKWNSEPVIECREIVCNWTGKDTIDNGKLVGLKDGKYLLDDKIKAVCDAGFKPTETAVCESNGCFSKTTVSCEEIHCLRLDNYNDFENGKIVYSNRPITVNSTATFYCDPGYVKFGTDVRTCQGDGSWSDDGCVTCQRLKYANEPPTLKTSCPAPCVPYGAMQEGSSYEIGDTVIFRCHEYFRDIAAVHAIARVCLENAMWNGSDIRCTGIKRPEGLLLGEAMENVKNRADQNFKEWEENNKDVARSRTIDIYNSLQLYLLVDSSGSITDETFEIMKKFINILLEKVFGGKRNDSHTDVCLQFFGRTLSTEFKFTTLTQFQNLNISRADATHLTAADTNIPKALTGLKNVIQTQREIDLKNDYSPNRVLIVISDGQNNMGGDIEQDIINELHSSAETYSIFVGKNEREMEPIDKRGFQLMRKLASTNKNEQDEHFFNIALDNSTEGLKSIMEQMTNVTPDRIQCGEFSGLTNLNKYGKTDSMTNALDGAWPWMVNLEDGSKDHKCGATILNENWILTAAHCLVAKEWKIYIGRLDRSDTGGSFIETSMDKTIQHPKYNATTLQYDIRVVRLANPVVYKKKKPYAAPVCLYNATEFPNLNYEDLFKPKSRGVVTGWGMQSKDGAASTTLKQLQLSILDSTKCREDVSTKGKKIFNDTVSFCALGKTEDDRTVDACEGDSGGPFVVKVDRMDSSKNIKPAFIQIGIVSWGFQCEHNKPGYYVRLTPEIIDWINDKISEK
ncbi:hypothetical protein ACJMK2_025143 [Sinanodonta woodiana]|uniref:C3/C5 convertase n=1 Tax=Sinanodonta woodiana TaxID=1069815 RepID=A0ABD3XFK4_SINWO